MRIHTYGQQLEITDALRTYIEDKFSKLQRHFDHYCNVRVQMGITKPHHNVLATAQLRGCTIHANASAATMYAAIDRIADKLDRLILKHKNKTVQKRRSDIHRTERITTLL